MESRRQRAARNRNRSLNKKLMVPNSAEVPMVLPNIDDLIAYGDVTIGVLRPVGCVATAADEDRCLAMLVGRRGETLGQLLTRLSTGSSTRPSMRIFLPMRSIRRQNAHS
jgi:hypothetical protein